MKLIKLIIICAFILTTGCSSTSKQSVLEYLSSDSSNRYKIHLFYDNQTQLDDKLLEYMNSKKELLERIQGIQLYDVEVKKNKKMADAIGIDEFPAIIVTDNKEITLKTQNLNDIKNYFNKLSQ
ncbi:hypothetical protein [Paenibacillus sp. FSL W8-0194]|uniref:hypothetical protein n=1 Tax=Paenibacillus sp. FSL W8-0194 TaxID=2921711 RepID=UPI0030DC436A